MAGTNWILLRRERRFLPRCGSSQVLQVFPPVTIPAPNTFLCLFLKAKAAPGSP